MISFIGSHQGSQEASKDGSCQGSRCQTPRCSERAERLRDQGSGDQGARIRWEGRVQAAGESGACVDRVQGVSGGQGPGGPEAGAGVSGSKESVGVMVQAARGVRGLGCLGAGC